MADNFNESLSSATVSVEDAKKDAYNAKVRETRRQNLALWKDSFDKELAENGDQIIKALSTRSGDIQVLKALSFGEAKYIIRKDGAGQEVKEPVPNIIGYKVKNISTTPIPCYTTKCSLVEGVYVKEPVQTAIAPGATLDLRKADFVTLMAAPEFSFTAANGKLTTRSYTGTSEKELEAFLEKHNFLFADGVKVGEMLEQISTNVNGVDTVLPNYKDTFAFLENKETKKDGAGRKAKENKRTAQELAANYVRRLIAHQA